MATVTRFAQEHNIKGRGRCAPEGLNCTLSGSALGVRAFCQALRDWNATFKETDFKVCASTWALEGRWKPHKSGVRGGLAARHFAAKA